MVRLQRSFLSLLQLLLFLPFATITDCNSGQSVNYSGVGLFLSTEGGGPILFGFYLSSVLLLIFLAHAPVENPLSNLIQWSLRALGSWFSLALVWVLPYFVGLFDHVEVKPPWILMLLGWGVAYIIMFGAAFRSLGEVENPPTVPERWGVTMMMGITGVASVLTAIRCEHPGQILFFLIVPNLMSLPMTTLGLGLGWQKTPFRWLWWAGVGLWCIAMVASTFD
jgi:hypothetical protein